MILAAGSNARARKVKADEFARLYENAFADAIDNRLLEPLGDAEFRRMAAGSRRYLKRALTNRSLTQNSERIKWQYPLAIANELRLVCAVQFLRETELPASQWQEARHRILVVHDRTPLPDLLGPRIYGAHLTDLLKKRFRRHWQSPSRHG